jgi:acyl-coenzyme A thioesterase PaaI-like protein
MSDSRGARDPFDAERFMAAFQNVGHGGALGIHYRDHGTDWVELGLDYAEHLIGMPETGIIASGPIISLMDMATTLSIWRRLGTFRQQATLDLRIDYLRPAVPGRTIIGRGECYGLTRAVAFVRGLAHDGDELDPVANVTGTFLFTG